MTDTGSPTDAQPSDNSAEAFPARLRVHALARTLGVTSRDVLAHLHELGVVARSASSSISGEQAQSVADRLAAPAEAESAAEPELAAEPAPAAESAGAVTESLFSAITVEEPSAAGAVAAEVSPLFLPPSAPKTAPEPEKAAAGTSKTATPETETPKAESTAPEKSEAEPVETAAEQADEAEQPEGADTAENADDTEDGQQRARRRRRGRRGRGRGRGDAAETDGAADDSAADTEAPAEETPAAEAAESAAAEAEPAADQRADEKRGDRKKGKSKKAKAAADEEQPAEGDSSETAAEDTSADDADAEGENGDGDEAATPTSKRRRRRRRRKGGAGDGEEASPDDPPNTVVHEREPRAKKVRDEVQGISGSTRLEAKRQRRRDGRDAGRRRPPILSESEFLARREAVERVMVVRERVVDPAAAAADPHAPTEDYTQVAVLEDGVLVEHFVTTETSQSMVGNIYLGRVQNVLPGMEAAFVDIGRGRNGVLYAGEVNWEAAGLDGGSRKIEQALKPGDYVLVQVSKDPVGHKGARLTTQVSLAGRYLVYVPGGTSTGISRKLPDTERKRLKSILSKLVPDEAGVIIRTASEGVSAEELGADIARLETQWKGIEAAAAEHTAKASGTTRALYEEPDLLVRVVRDLFNEDFTKLVVEGEKAWDQVSGYVTSVAPDLSERVTRFEKESPTAADVFGVYRIDEQLTKALDRKVWLPSGGTLIIEHTEAMTVVDVNTGKFTGAGGNLEETVTRNNLEAAEEIVRQMRLRDIGGMIIVDFIDMVLESNRDLVLRRLTEALARDRTRHQVSEVTSLGLVQMTRKRLGTGLLEAFSTTCQTCHGRGVIVHQNPVEVRSGGETPGEGGSKRSRRNKRKSEKADAPAPVVESKAHKPAAEHPLFKAMAHHEDDETGTMVEAVDDAAAALAAEAESAFTAVAALAEGMSVEVIETVTEVVEAAEVRAEEETAVVAGLVVQTEVVEAVLAGAAAPEAEAVAAESAAQAPSAETPSAEGGPAVVRRRRRATRRPSAPSAPAEPLVVTAETPVTTVAAQTEAPVVEVTRKPRRRTSRRAGAGNTASGPNVTASPPAQA
ncbi:translation initiation factor IF-2 N-terminal domain-containing protein [Gordonia sp. PP30]|uniref:translation initiation factor IF-2 N-terminal domain-containing protein n=1 Tax=Gordonia sp. PP30 TaxID=2935861 RepID=UPI00200032DB|nr:translation initiation factor IF-2 N-terminal domain-containing protein [Gordonia sp. PP30]UQE76549.1 translation initiation factor IF-2 N-terminal domain-containing protein [Gordonia sp. PP30]